MATLGNQCILSFLLSHWVPLSQTFSENVPWTSWKSPLIDTHHSVSPTIFVALTTVILWHLFMQLFDCPTLSVDSKVPYSKDCASFSSLWYVLCLGQCMTHIGAPQIFATNIANILNTCMRGRAVRVMLDRRLKVKTKTLREGRLGDSLMWHTFHKGNTSAVSWCYHCTRRKVWNAHIPGRDQILT